MSIAGQIIVDADRVRRNWGWYVLLGIVLILLGGVALANPLGIGLATMLMVGILLIASGVTEVIVAFQTRGSNSIALNLLAAILEIVVGILILKRPGEALAIMTMLMTAYFLVGGVFRIVAAFALNVPGSGWLAVSGLVTTLLGIMLLSEWPEPTAWLIGTLIAVDLIFHGVSWIILALGLRKGTPAIS